MTDHTDNPTGSTVFEAADGDATKRAAIERSIAAHGAVARLAPRGFLTDQQILIVVHPGFEMLDAIGPMHFLAATGATVHLASTGAAGEPVLSGNGVSVLPTVSLAEADDAPTVILVPGGDTGILLRDDAAMASIERIGHGAQYVTSVCTGSIALAAAGLLDGLHATSHWAFRHLLTGYGAIEVDERVVEDGNRMTAAGVTAGMDLAIALVAKLCGDDYARFSVLGAEYAPQLPFEAGTPMTAGDELTNIARDFFAPMEEELRARQSR
ncbi:MAG: DJ-1/PfpI family protein [Rhodococcus sp. (in: high G+C Gram-positive bacteria)]|uniref:DJ-1/PfpI family protein n=1 Tax=Rhodococcus sp. TaxID=1831 RepID=UPI002ADBED3E|nr:DJ-1/PfpI family protein [Rhodococcus sp. (in: high G+C Gram-positive bacteria)]